MTAPYAAKTPKPTEAITVRNIRTGMKSEITVENSLFYELADYFRMASLIRSRWSFEESLVANDYA